VSILDILVKFDTLVKIDASVKDGAAWPVLEDIMASQLQGKGVLSASYGVGEAGRDGPAPFTGAARRWADLRGAVADRFRKWRENRQTLDALRHLDDRQLSEFGIHRRTPDLSARKFP
jgi:uncharacterized protein YjiS (DUF1127 family)